MNIKIGDLLENEELGLTGEVVEINEDTGEVTVAWADGDETIEEKISLESLLGEDSAALETVKPNSRPASEPRSRVEYIRGIVGKVAEMEDSELVDFFNKVQGSVGKEGDVVPDNSAKNRASVAMKGSVKEDVEKLFEGQELSEEFKDRTTTLFEAAVASRVIIVEEELREEYAKALDEEVKELTEDLTNRTQEYLDHVATKWLEENQIAVESTLRTNVTKNFIEGMKQLFAEHDIDIPDERIDVVAEQAELIERMQKEIDTLISDKAKLEEEAVLATLEGVFEEVADGLAVTQSDKFRTLAEGVDFDGDVEKYREKLELIRETHFKNESKKPTVMLEDTFVGEQTITEEIDPRVRMYVDAIRVGSRH